MNQSLFKQPLNLNKTKLFDLLSTLQKEPGAIFLDSASNNHVDSNVSVFMWAPLYTIETYGAATQVYQNDTVIETSNDDPLSIVEKYLSRLPLKDAPLPFYGGAAGYFEYELGGRFERLPTPKTSDINLPNMFVGIYPSAIVINNDDGNCHFISQGDDADQQWQRLQHLISDIPQNNDLDFRLCSKWQSNMTHSQYQTKFNQVQEYLLSGDCYQINLAQRFSAQYSGNEWQAYCRLREQNSAPFSSFIRLTQGAILSVSPERFLQVKDKKIETKPIKGTRPRSEDPITDQTLANELRHAPKDNAENLMIVDLLRNDLSKVAVPGSVDVPKLFAIESFPAVHHLVSTVTATLDNKYSSLDLLRGAFPGGSITGAPKIRAMEIIHELEPNPRSVYCGAIGYIKPNGDMDTNITIRTLVCNQGQIHCWAGGGLVADSKCDDEYQETLDKVNKILPILTEM